MWDYFPSNQSKSTQKSVKVHTKKLLNFYINKDIEIFQLEIVFDDC